MTQQSREKISAWVISSLIAIWLIWFVFINRGFSSPVEYWKAWAVGKVGGQPDSNRLYKGFSQFFAIGELTPEQITLLEQHTHAKVESKKGVMVYCWGISTTSSPDSGEGERIYQVTVDHTTNSITDIFSGQIVD